MRENSSLFLSACVPFVLLLIGCSQDDKHDSELGYLWRHRYFDAAGKRYDSYLATGNGGQKINIWPEQNMITVFTGGNYNSYFLYGRTIPPNEMIPGYILKALY